MEESESASTESWLPDAGRRVRSWIRLAMLLTLGGVVEAQWLQYPTPGVPRLPDGNVNLAAPPPRFPDGRPDLSGIWNNWNRESPGQNLYFDLAQGLPPSDVVMTPCAAAVQAQRKRRDRVDDPNGYCLPPGTPRISFTEGPFKIIQTPQLIAFLHETLVGMMFRQVFLDDRPLPQVTEPTWLGYSIGRWEGDTLVVESTGFRDGGWLDAREARPHSDAMRVTERFRRLDVGHMELVLTINDPKAYLKPWTVKTRFTLRPDSELLEAFCDNHARTMEHRRIDPAPPEPPSASLP